MDEHDKANETDESDYFADRAAEAHAMEQQQAEWRREMEQAKGGEHDLRKALDALGKLPKRRIEISPDGFGFMTCKTDADAIEAMLSDIKEGEETIWHIKSRMMTDEEYNRLPEHMGF